MILPCHKQRLSSDCEDQIRIIIQESALDYRLDPQLQLHCSDEVGFGYENGCEQSWSKIFLLESSSLLSLHSALNPD